MEAIYSAWIFRHCLVKTVFENIFWKNCKKVLTDGFFCGNLIELSEIIVSENMKN